MFLSPGSRARPRLPARKFPTTVTFTSGTGTYVPKIGVLWIKVRLVGGGSGGQGGGTNGTQGNGGQGGFTTFGGLSGGPGNVDCASGDVLSCVIYVFGPGTFPLTVNGSVTFLQATKLG